MPHPVPGRGSLRGAALLSVLALGPIAAQDPPAWKVDSTRAPSHVLEFTATEGSWMSVDVSPDGRFVAFDLLGQIYEMPIGGGDARRLTEGRSWNLFPRYSPDGGRILFTSDRTGIYQIWALVRNADSVVRISKGDQWTAQGAWSADGRFVYATVMDLGARFNGVRIDAYGDRTDLGRPALFTPPTHFNERAADGKVYYSEPAGPVYRAGFQINAYDLGTGRIETVVRRPGGAVSPSLSHDGRWMAYVHREDQTTELVLHDLTTGLERVLFDRLDRDRQEAGAGADYGAYPHFAWTPDDRAVVIAYGGHLQAIDVASGATREIPFRAPVRRVMEETIRFPVTIPASGKALTRSHRFGIPADQGVIFEALGNLYYRTGDKRIALTDTPAHETSPAYDPATRTVYYAAWTDDSLGSLWRRPLLAGSAPVRLPARPSQFGSLTLSPDGQTLAYLRGADALARGGVTLDGQGTFELMVMGPDQVERKVTDVDWGEGQFANFATHLPPGITFSPDGQRLYFTEFTGDSLALKRIRLDGLDEQTLYYFPHAVHAVISPDLRWIAFREYTRTFVTPNAFAGKPVSVSAFDHLGTTFRVDSLDGDYTGWTRDGQRLYWTRGDSYFEKPLADVIAARARRPARCWPSSTTCRCRARPSRSPTPGSSPWIRPGGWWRTPPSSSGATRSRPWGREWPSRPEPEPSTSRARRSCPG